MEKKELTNWQAVGIGAWVGFGFILLIAVFLFLVIVPAGIVPSIITALPVMLFGITGAMIGKYWKKTRFATWTGALLSSVVFFVIVVFLILFVLAGIGG